MLEADIQSHSNRIRDDGFTVIEHAASSELVEGLKEALLRTERDHHLGYAKTSFEGFKTVRINNLLTYDDIFWEVPLHENVLPIVERVLDRECLLSSFCSLVLGPGQEAQPIHEDTQLIHAAAAYSDHHQCDLGALGFPRRQWRNKDRPSQPQI
jgi:Phytanoyl-CoA dioxygenase (PhyH)